MAKTPHTDPVIANNRKAYHDYTVLEKYEAGIKLRGTEVKSCRAHDANLQDSFVRLETNEAWLQNSYIAPYDGGNRFNHEPKRPRQLLLHANEILKLAQQVKVRHLTVIPLQMYFHKNLIKVELGLCQGKTHADKREVMRKKQDLMDAKRAMADRRKD